MDDPRQSSPSTSSVKSSSDTTNTDAVDTSGATTADDPQLSPNQFVKENDKPTINSPVIETATASSGNYYQPVGNEVAEPEVASGNTDVSASTADTNSASDNDPSVQSIKNPLPSPSSSTTPQIPQQPIASAPPATSPSLSPSSTNSPSTKNHSHTDPQAVMDNLVANVQDNVAGGATNKLANQSVQSEVNQPASQPVNSKATPSANNPNLNEESNDMVKKMQQANQTKPNKWRLLKKIGLGVVLMAFVGVAVFWGYGRWQQQANQATVNNLPADTTPADNGSSDNAVSNTGANNNLPADIGNSSSTGENNLPAAIENSTVKVSGEVCAATAGNLYFYNLDHKEVMVKEIPINQSSFSVNVPHGQYKVFFETTGTKSRAGVTNASHDLETLAINLDMSNVSVCDYEMNNSSVPQESYAFGGFL